MQTAGKLLKLSLIIFASYYCDLIEKTVQNGLMSKSVYCDPASLGTIVDQAS